MLFYFLFYFILFYVQDRGGGREEGSVFVMEILRHFVLALL